MDEEQWNRVTNLFDRLLEEGHPEFVLDQEPDGEIRDAAMALWSHHQQADRENYLSAPLEIEIAPVLVPGQLLLERFEIQKLIGKGGMGEVYLALDRRVGDRVAIKTMSSLLARSEPIRRQFAVEVRSARKVTHPNVCRIHELFEERGRIFFTMEYLEGESLAEALTRQRAPRDARAILSQVAEGLLAAHKTGVVHGDVKPGNVMLTRFEGESVRVLVMDFGLARAVDRAGVVPGEPLPAGTVEYMAPELLAGAYPTVRSDIFAFGKLAAKLLSADRYWTRCSSDDPEMRPKSFEPIVRRLNKNRTRRYWIAGAAMTAGGFALWGWHAQGLARVWRQNARVLVNGFRGSAGTSASMLRSLLLTALQQSSMIRAIADQDILPALRRLDGDSKMPVGGGALSTLLRQTRADYWIEGELHQSGGRFSAEVRVLEAGSAAIVALSSVRDVPSVLALAQTLAVWVRRLSGESRDALERGRRDIASYTSAVPEALERYYEAMDHYAVGEMDQALPLLVEAVRLDPNFAQAHSMLAVTTNALRRYEESYREAELGANLDQRLPDREREWIQMNFYRITEDEDRALEAANANLALHPDEPRAHATLGELEAKSGHWNEAISELQKAATMAPDDWMFRLLLQDALVEAGKPDQAVQEFEKTEARGRPHQWMYNSLGSAYMLEERYAEALKAFESEPTDAGDAADREGARIMQGHLEVACAAFEEQYARARSPVERHQASEFLCGLHFVMDHPAEAKHYSRRMGDLPPFPPMARRLEGAASWARRVNDEETLSRIEASVAEIARRWPNQLTEAVYAHVGALRFWSQRELDKARELLLQASGKAFSVWTTFDIAELFTHAAQWELAEKYWAEFEARRGTLLVKGWFPATQLLAWQYRAMAARARSDNARAFLFSKKVLDHWALSCPHLQLVRSAAIINAAAKPL